MYIYFDKNGTIKEVINDESIRKGSNDYNKIYCYLEGNPDIDDIWYLQKNPDGTLTNEVSFIDNIVTKSIPYDSHRDMKYFQDFEEYKFYVFTLSSSYLSQNGLVVATIRVAENNTLWALGELTFNVQANIVNSDNDITQSQYDYLLLTISSYYSKTEIDNKLNLKADKSDTYTKAQTDNLLNSKTDKTYVDNALSEKADKSDTYTKSEVDSALFKKANSDNVYSKNQVDNLLDGKVNYSDTYTRNVIDNFVLDLEVKKANKSDVYTKTEVDGKFEGAGEEFSTLENAILDLQTSVDDLKSVQNVVDVVPTYAALQKYDASKVETYDKIQVIADETHDGASTIYNRLGSFWYYVGAFGTNSYTKTEVDTKLSTKADKTDTYTKTEVDTKLSTKADKNNTYTKQEVDGKFALTSDIPTVNDPTITFTQGGVTKGSISLNQATDQTIELDGFSIGTYLEDIYDSHENNRFINGYGIWSAVSGMQGAFARWSLNGYNLMFEALGTFQTNVNTDTNIVSFKLPNWILNKITTPFLDVVDMFNFSIVNQSAEISSATLMIVKTSDRVIFNAPNGVTFTQPVIFRIRYNLIIADD